MFVSVIVSTYKDAEALRLILEALECQTYRDFELIVAEDDNSKEVADLLRNSSYSYPIKHYYHEDTGWRKAVALNHSIAMSSGEYLIFFDGDCLPYSTFVASHVALAQKQQILCGRRVNLEAEFSAKLRAEEITINKIEQNFFRHIWELQRDGARHIEQGIHLNPKLFKPLITLLDRRVTLVGCNFSLHKEHMLHINGFDESYPSGDVADDVDIEWRVEAIGVKKASCRFATNLLHLHHTRADRTEAHRKNLALMREKRLRGEHICKQGIAPSS